MTELPLINVASCRPREAARRIQMGGSRKTPRAILTGLLVVQFPARHEFRFWMRMVTMLPIAIVQELSSPTFFETK